MDSLLESHYEVDSIICGDATASINSEKEFQFDDVVTNSHVYRRVLTQRLEHETRKIKRSEEDLGDLVLVDLSETVDVKVEDKTGAFSSDLELLVLPIDEDDHEYLDLEKLSPDDGKQNPNVASGS